MLDRLNPILERPPRNWEPEPLSAENRRDVLVDDDPPPAIRALVVEGITPEAYWPKLAEFLGALACGDEWVAKGIAARILNPWVRAEPYANPVATKLLDPACAGGQALRAETVAELRRLMATVPAVPPASPIAAGE